TTVKTVVTGASCLAISSLAGRCLFTGPTTRAPSQRRGLSASSSTSLRTRAGAAPAHSLGRATITGMIYRKRNLLWACVCVVAIALCVDVQAQRKSKKKPAPAQPPGELEKLRDEYVKATNEYKASLGKLLPYYQSDVKKAEDKLELSKKLLAEGLIPKSQVEENERALAVAKQKIAETNRAMTSADEQVAAVLVEAEANDQIAKNLRLAKQGLVRTSAFTRYTGSG